MSVVFPNRSPIYCLCPFGKLIGLCFYPFSFQLWCMQLCSETWQLLYNGCIHDGRYTRASGVIWKISSPCTRWANFPSDHFHNRDAPPPPIQTWLVGAFSSGMAAENIMNSVCFSLYAIFLRLPGKCILGARCTFADAERAEAANAGLLSDDVVAEPWDRCVWGGSRMVTLNKYDL